MLIFQNDLINKYTTTVLTIPFTTNLRRAAMPSCVLVPKGEGGLTSDSVALCHQLRVLDKARLHKKTWRSESGYDFSDRSQSGIHDGYHLTKAARLTY